ncbi:staygreen family protein [Gorillibacterium massiliense]|uniref:staygreen family protein n=1 Tax=Gorillibacterium massiliense TaxID=1280390 RepID=UPI000593FB2B|nr:staygreen family protein [Gorillibacterium massiliense]
MPDFNPRKLSVNLIPPATFTQPAEGRKYTLTHSDNTGQLFLDIGYKYNLQAVNPQMRDEVLAEWKKDVNGYSNLIGSAHVDGGEFSLSAAGVRLRIFMREMTTALKGIVYGDRPFYAHYPHLLDAPIFIHYRSSYPQYSQILYYGTPRQYLS